MMHATADTTKSETILAQLGGRRFIALTGAKHFLSTEKGNGLQFKLPSNFAKNGINTVRIVLRWDDFYDVEYGVAHEDSYEVVSKSEGLYSDDLQRDFTKATGLYTFL